MYQFQAGHAYCDMIQGRIPDSWTNQRSNLSYFHYVTKPQTKPTTEDDSAVPAQPNPRSYPELLHHYYHGPLNQRKASRLAK